MVSTPNDSDEHESGDDDDQSVVRASDGEVFIRAGDSRPGDGGGNIRGGGDARIATGNTYGYATLVSDGSRWEFRPNVYNTPGNPWTITSTDAGLNYTISTSTPSQPTVSPGFDMSVYTPSMTHFQEWIERLVADEDVHFNYQGGNNIPPYFNHGSFRDYEYVMEISGHTIMGYADGRPRIPEGGTAIRFPLAGQDEEDVLIGYTMANGMYLSLDPRYLRFVTRNEETGLWDHVEVEDGEPNACHILLEAIGTEAFFRRWRPPTLEDIMQRTWLQKRDRQISTANRRINDFATSIADGERRLEMSRQGIVTARATLAEWGHMTLEKFMETINVYRDQLQGIGNNLEVTEGTVSIILNSFEIQGVTLGPYKISFDLAESRIKVNAHDNTNPSRNGHIHPHVSGETVCWGDADSVYNASVGNPFEALFLTAGFLKTAYSAGGAYCRLESWASNDTYFCDFCNTRHPNSTGCPAECGECNAHVDWNVHAHCEHHFVCHDTDDGNDGCRVCVEEREEVEKKRVAELEAKQAAQKQSAKSSKKKAKKKTTKKATKKKARKKTSKRQSRRTVIMPVPEAAE